jgi:hypothetical protein
MRAATRRSRNRSDSDDPPEAGGRTGTGTGRLYTNNNKKHHGLRLQQRYAAGNGSNKCVLFLVAFGILLGYVLVLRHVVPENLNIDAALASLPKDESRKQQPPPPPNPKINDINHNNVQITQRKANIRKDPVLPVKELKDMTAQEQADTTTTERLVVAQQRLESNQHFVATQSIPTATTPYVMTTLTLPDHARRKILVTGGAGFVGSHLVDRLMMQGHEVIVVDNYFTGQQKNIAHWLHHPNFKYVLYCRYNIMCWRWYRPCSFQSHTAYTHNSHYSPSLSFPELLLAT